MNTPQKANPMSSEEKGLLKVACENSHLAFTRCFFRERVGVQQRFMVSPHHKLMAETLDKVYRGEIKRLIINVPPGYTKTEMAVINFVAHGLALNPYSRFIHVSYSDSLALLNSTLVRDVVKLPLYRSLWRVDIRKDASAKKSWTTKEGGGMLAMASGGSITGFRAGQMMKGFSGALIVDDPLKPDDAYSKVKRESVNVRFTNTFASRMANPEVPMVVIMQRLHEDDPTGYLLKGGSGEKWHHLLLPAHVKEEPEPYPVEYTHGIPIEYELPIGPLWEYKHTLEMLKAMEESDIYTYASQYDQRPAPLGGGIFKGDWWKFYEEPPICEYRFITGDTAQKTEEHNDYSVFQLWGYKDGKIYLLDQIRDKWEAPDLKRAFVAFWNAHVGTGSEVTGHLREAYIEDKASGTGLIQDVQADEKNPIPVVAVQRNRDKITRAMDMAPYIQSGYVYLPERASWLNDYLSEFAKFTPMMTHKHDDQIDPTLDAIDKGLRPAQYNVEIW